jgi:hypothetical protein
MVIDTNGNKGLLAKAQLGYDGYALGGDEGRVWIGTGTENIALAKLSEIQELPTNPLISNNIKLQVLTLTSDMIVPDYCTLVLEDGINMNGFDIILGEGSKIRYEGK